MPRHYHIDYDDPFWAEDLDEQEALFEAIDREAENNLN